MHKSPRIRESPKVPLPGPLKHPEWYGEVSFRFPSGSVMFSTHFGQYLKAKIELWTIAIEIASIVFVDDTTRTLSVGQILAFGVKLKEWYANLPEPLQPRRIVTPYQLQLQ